MDSSQLAPDIRIREWRIKLDLFGYLGVTAFFASTLSRLNQIHTLRAFIFHILINLAAFAGTYYFWRLAAFLVYQRGNRPLSLGQIWSIGFAGGAVFTVCESVTAWLFQLHLTPNFLVQLIAFSLPAAFWLPAGSVISNNYRKYLRIKKTVRDELLQQESVRLARRRALDEYRLKLEAQIQDSLRLTTQQASSLFNSLKEREVENLPEYLRIISGEYFRLTAHKMLSSSDENDRWFAKFKAAVSSFFDTVRTSVETRPLNPLWFAIMVAVTAIPPVVQKHDPSLSVEIILVIGIVSYLIQAMQLQIAKHYQVNSVKLSIVVTALNVVLPLIAVRSLPSNTPQLLYPVGFTILVLALTCLGYLAQAGLLQSEDFRDRAMEPVNKIKENEKEASLVFADITRNWARYIHGSFTSKLEASALALEAALKTNDFTEVERAISDVTNFLKSEKVSQPMAQEILLDEINERCKNWSSLIEFEIASNIERENIVGVSVQQVGTCLEEAILNASRHGNCTWIGIEIVNTETLFQIIFKDNGNGFASHEHGFGSRIFTEATDGQWDIWRDEPRGLTILQLNFRKIP